MLRPSILLYLALATVLLAGYAAAQTDTTENAAAVQQKPASHRRHIITNDDLSPRGDADSETAKPKPADDAAAANAKHDQAAELAKVGTEKSSEADVKQAIEQIIKQEVALKEKLNRIRERLATEDDDFRREMWNDALENQKATLEQFRKVRERLEQQIDSPKRPANTAPGS